MTLEGKWVSSAARKSTLFFLASFNIRPSSFTLTLSFLSSAVARRSDSASLLAVFTPPISSRKFSFIDVQPPELLRESRRPLLVPSVEFYHRLCLRRLEQAWRGNTQNKLAGATWVLTRINIVAPD